MPASESARTCLDPQKSATDRLILEGLESNLKPTERLRGPEDPAILKYCIVTARYCWLFVLIMVVIFYLTYGDDR